MENGEEGREEWISNTESLLVRQSVELTSNAKLISFVVIVQCDV
jgi:hypothetical protein